jgi:hypothetical protein
MSTWIPCDFCDNPDGRVLVWDGRDMLVAVRLCGAWHEIATGMTVPGVTHWTVLPEPPSEAA